MPEGQNSDYVVVGANGQLYVGETYVTAPTNALTPLTDANWYELGFVSEEGATFAETKEVADINAWQSFYPIRRLVTSRLTTLSFVLRQWTRQTIEFALGGTVTTNGGEFKYTPPTATDLDERSLVLQWQDGSKDYRLYFPKGIVTGAVETNLVRTAAADFPIEFSPIDPGGGIPIYTLFTDDQSFATGS